ncbi:MAG: WecB/TagA/CpsF family glycosyltransferase [Bacillota bacterium]|nr:WecB/TagA/CpsF family glycosyltransferase [Eubacteriales bacterium]MDI9492757.1 WecB/TagA/CpsF family glycosyltransferase [Bacillota bacterium]NLV70615.1 WecB/TagA/CpsF family glycosyltransferase [Clostridiales bacterium]MDD3536675.1 WecB/TagA/CpsF family glycosyltransferase [Eubacteriales bacterium]MDD4286304.1 WecB/TagA/CpsF family glycosyltransferase [Eubacteriales bacterium]
MMERKSRINIVGIPVDDVTLGDALSVFEDLMKGPRLSLIATPNSEIVMMASKDPSFAEILDRAELVIPDGIGLLYASKMLGRPLKERVAGIDFAQGALERTAQLGYSVFFFGGRPGIAEKAAENKRREIPGLRIAGTRHGYFTEEEIPSIVEEINGSGADFLCVALGARKQEQFIDAHRDALHARVGVGIGGSLDVWSGSLKRAPAFYRKNGLEWLYRLKQEPSRIRRIRVLPAFLANVATQRMKEEL